MKISNEFVLKNIAGNNVVVPVGKKSIDFNAIIHLNDVGSFIFKCLQENDLSKEELAKKVVDEYEVEYEIALKDVTNFCNKLKENKMLIQ